MRYPHSNHGSMQAATYSDYRPDTQLEQTSIDLPPLQGNEARVESSTI